MSFSHPVPMARGAALGLCVGMAALAGVAPTGGAAQTPTMPSTLRYGSGLMDVPVSSVLPHLHVTGTLSGFGVALGRTVQVDETGLASGYGPARHEFLTDGSVAIGLYDRAEAGLTFQSFGADDEGGDMWGLFGRVRILEPIDQGIGLAVGGRYVTSPSFGDGVEYQPGRLGFADPRLRKSYTTVRGLSSKLSLYGVATAYLRGFDGGPLPENDLSFSLGYGGGMFGAGSGLDFYSGGHGGGWFVGTSLDVAVGDRSQVTLMAEHNGFDVNVGAQFDWDGVRVGAQWLSTNHDWPLDGHVSEYLKPRLGLLASVAVCPRARGLRCRPHMMRRSEPDTIYLPPPPPDTVVVRVGVEPSLPADTTPQTVCLSTGRNVSVAVSAAGDTLIGDAGVPLEELRPALDFAGSYAGGAFWFRDDRVIVFEGGDFGKSEDSFPVDCDQILRVGVYEGVPVFAVISARRPLDVIFIPVRPGVWQRYERGRRSPDL